MNFKKLSLAALSLTLAAGMLAGCGSTKPDTAPTTAPTAAPTQPAAATTPAPSGGNAVKTGLSVITSVSGSKAPTADAAGVAQSDIGLVAVTVDENGVIDSCVIDVIQAKIGFDATGKLTTDPATEFPSKNMLGDAYDMKKASSIGKEWNEQAAAFAAYVVGKTVDEVKGIAVNEKGGAADADLAASVTLGIGDFVAGIENAVKNAADLGAQKGDKLALSSSTNMSKSKDAAADADGLAQAYATVAAVTFSGNTITSCAINAVQANVDFNAAGAITSDLSAAVPSKNELGDAYGMKKVSSIGKEWNEQAAGFAAYITGKTVDEVTGLAVNEKGGAADADLAASVTVGIGEFQELIAQAAG